MTAPRQKRSLLRRPHTALWEGRVSRMDLGAPTWVARRYGRGCTLDSELREAASAGSSSACASAVATSAATGLSLHRSSMRYFEPRPE
jgi:hypothetical protein